MFSRSGYLAGSDERRRAELALALEDPSVKAIVAARGGYGAARLVQDLDFEALRRSPRWIVGFSDITALHVEAWRVGVRSLHACHVASLGRGDAVLRAGLVRALEAPTAAATFAGLETLRAGRAEGPLVGGNLTLLQACAAAGRLVLPDGCVLLLEDVTECPYRLDRMLTSLEAGGHFARVAAFALGEFFRCDPGPDGVRAEDVLRDRLTRLGVPVVAKLPIGHGRRNEPVVLGARARVDAPPMGSAILHVG
jgi:muramoyltetrapeptide carboxypeptidase